MKVSSRKRVSNTPLHLEASVQGELVVAADREQWELAMLERCRSKYSHLAFAEHKSLLSDLDRAASTAFENGSCVLPHDVFTARGRLSSGKAGGQSQFVNEMLSLLPWSALARLVKLFQERFRCRALETPGVASS